MNWRRNFWRWVRRSVDEGALLPRWAIVVRWILFPMDSAYWHLASTRGYNPLRDTWLIDGMEFTGAAMHALVNSHGQVFRITRTGQTVTLERVQPALDAREAVAADWKMEVKSSASDEEILTYLDELLDVQGRLMFAKGNAPEPLGEVFGVAILDFMRLHGMRVREIIRAAHSSGSDTQ